MSIQLEPTELYFERPFTREVTQTLRIKNTNYDPIAFKVKTTAPKQYCVRPNSGRIEAGKEVEVQVHLQPMKQDPPADFKCRDKFLVQSVPITADREAVNIQTIWSQVEKTEKSAITEKKIRVAFLQPGEVQPSSYAGTIDNSQYEPSSSPAPYGAAKDIMSTPQPNAPVAPKHASKPESVYSQTASELPGSSPQPTTDELSAAKATIAKLEAELQEKELRLRKTVGVAADKADQIIQGSVALTTSPPAGVPVQVTAGLCLLAFLIAYLCF